MPVTRTSNGVLSASSTGGSLGEEQPATAVSWISDPVFHAPGETIVQEAVAVLCRNSLGRAYRSAILAYSHARSVVPLRLKEDGLDTIALIEPFWIPYGHIMSQGRLRVQDCSGRHTVEWTILDVYDSDPKAALAPFNEARFAVLNFWLDRTGYLSRSSERRVLTHRRPLTPDEHLIA